MPPLPLSPLVGPSPSYRRIAAPSPHLLLPLLLRSRVAVVVPQSPLVPPHTTTTQQLRLNSSSSSSSSLLSAQNHYQRLNIPGDASPSTIKKSFYALSKTHHPDVNRSDPSAAITFSLLSESYTVLSDPARRAAYDKQLFPPSSSSSSSSYSSSGAAASAGGPGWNPAGGRCPSGLSRRRGSFRGPPASFYRNGGYGAHAAQRSKQQQRQTNDGEAAGAAHRHASHTDPLHHHQQYHQQQQGFYNEDDVPPHFDKAGHKRTHERQDERRHHQQGRSTRRALGDDDVEFEPQTSMAGHFFIVAGILGVTFAAPLVYLQCMRLGRKEKKGPRA